MRVFISWSGSTSRSVAEALAEWLPKVVQGIEPFVSAKDIDKGANWTVELANELESTEFGIICLAPDNLLSPWLNYETGAITRSVSSRVCPVLFNVRKEDVKPPMAQLQLTSIELEEFVLLINSVNKAAGGPLSAPAAREAVEVWWPRLEAELAKIAVPKVSGREETSAPAEPAQPQPDVTEMFEEMLSRMRSLDSRVRRLEPRPGPSQNVRSAARSTSSKHRPAVRFLTDSIEQAGILAFDFQTRDDLIELRLPEVTEVPDGIAEAAGVVARAEDISVIIRTRDEVRRWAGKLSEERGAVG